MSRLRQIVRALDLHRPGIVGIDGGLGAGKTTLAKRLSAQQRCTCLHLDAFLAQGRAAFQPSIDYGRLRSAIAASQGMVIVEGLCLLAVLERIGIVPDYLIFVDADVRYRNARKSPLLWDEIRDYLARYAPRAKADAVISLEGVGMNSSYDVDIAYIKSKTLVSITLAIGGILQTVVGALVLNSGFNQEGTASLKIMGAQVSATGLGGIVLCTSVLWAYFAYLARPKFSSRSETRNTTRADGSSEVYEFRSTTQIAVDPQPHGGTAADPRAPTPPQDQS